MNWINILIDCGVKKATTEKWENALSLLNSLIVTEIDDFLAQILHESSLFEHIEENLHYKSPERLMMVFGKKRFPTVEDAKPFINNPVGLANVVYGGRGGNNREGDGWKYRGRGLIQLTLRDNYVAVGKALGLDLVNNPDLLLEPEFAMKAAIAWWQGNIPDSIMGDIRAITKKVNGGYNGLEDRERLYKLCKSALVKHGIPQ